MDSPLSGFGLFNLSDRYGDRVLVHGGVEPYIRLSSTKKNMLNDAIEALNILYESKKTGEKNAI